MKRIYVILGINHGIFRDWTVCCQTCALRIETRKTVTSPEVMHGATRFARLNPWPLRYAAALLLLLSLAWAAPGRAGGNTPIFILHSYSQEYPWTKRQHEGFLRKLGAAVPDMIAASVEYLDTKRVPYTAAYADFVAAYLAQKYAGFEPKLIYVTDDNALLFALTHLRRIFPKAPIFFSGINDFDMKQRIDPRQVTGVYEEKEIAPNLDLMRHLAPGVRDILVVGDESETYQAIRREIVAELARQPDIQAQFLSSGRIERLVAALQGRTEQFVFLTTLGAMTDAAGNTLTLPETIAAIVRAGQFIIISMEDVYLYPGVLGGYVTSGDKQGAAAAELSARYLAGTAVAAIKPVESSPNEYIVDGGELESLGLTLPSELVGRTTILNPLPTFYQRNLKFIVRSFYAFALLFLVSLAVFMSALLRKNRQIARTSKDLAAQTQRLRTVIEGFPVVLWAVDREGVFTLSRGAGLKALKLAPDEVVGKSLFEIYRDIPTIIEDVRRAMAGVSHVSTNWVGALPFETHYAPLRDGSGAIVGATGVSIDVSERKRAEAALHQSEIQLKSILGSTIDGILAVDRDGKVIQMNQRFAQLWRIPQSLLDSKKDKTLLDFALGELADPEAFLQRVQALYQSDVEATDSIEFKDGRIFERHTSPLILNRSNIGRVWSFRDITERRHLEDEVLQLAFHDALTRLPNRRLLNDRLGQAMAASKRSGSYGAMMFLDLDDFKLLNDMHGHEVGDLLLVEAADRLKSCVREIDTVARFGGDEFVVMISELDADKSESRTQAGIIAEKIRAALTKPYVLRVRHEGTAETTVEHYCTASIGVALFSHHETSQDDVLKWADMAMYQAKEAGCNLIRFHGPNAGMIANGAQPAC